VGRLKSAPSVFIRRETRGQLQQKRSFPPKKENEDKRKNQKNDGENIPEGRKKDAVMFVVPIKH